MGATYRYIVQDVLLTFSETFNDRKISTEQCTYWCILVINRIMAASFKNGVRSGAYLNVFESVPIVKGGAGFIPDIPHVELPADIFNLDMDDGVNYISFTATPECANLWGRVFFDRSTFWDIVAQQSNPYEVASGGRPYFVRSANILYLYGINTLPINTVEMGLYTTVKPSLAAPFSLDDVVPLEDEDLLQVKYEVMKLAKYSWLAASDRAETGTDTTELNPNLDKAQVQEEARQGQ
jgi:hypothetical protein